LNAKQVDRSEISKRYMPT